MSREICVSDSTVLIGLAQVDRLGPLRLIFSRILIPETVADEVTEARSDAPGAREVADASWIERQRAKPLLVRPLTLLVDLGEAEAIAIAQSLPGSILLTDDRKARRVAKQLRIKILGTLGVLARAKRGGLVTAVRPLVAQLRGVGYRIAENVVEDFLRGLGE